MEKRLVTTLAMLSFAVLLLAQAPEKMTYQAVIRDASNLLVADAPVGMQISILQGSVNGTVVYVETQNPSTNLNGLVSLEIGAGNLVSGDFPSIDWSMGPFFIATATDPNGGNDYSITGTSQLLSVPYALHAKTAESVTNGNGFTHYVGEIFGGGVVFHVYRDADGSEHGLIVSLSDQSTGMRWNNLFVIGIGANSQSSWNGLTNSMAIINQSGHTQSAAQLCLDYENDGFDDWYLPSIDELTLLFNNRFNVNKSLSMVGDEIALLDFSQDFNYLHYWSSTEINNDQAWRFSFTPGANDFSHFALKESLNNVRAIRAF